MNEKSGSIALAILWMTLVSLLLMWLPVLGPLLAGIVGGKTAGGVARGLAAALLPAAALCAALFGLTAALTGLPVMGAVAALGAGVLILVQVGPLLVGALIGGLLA